MASFLQIPSIFLGLFLTYMLVRPAFSLTCTSQTFTGNARFSNCTDLPSLNSSLHWSYNPTNATLSIAFIAPPANPDGWIAWAINPKDTGMAGSQALIAFKASNGSMVVNTYNISSYKSIVESKLSFDVLDKRAESSNGSMSIFATLALPGNMTTLNQVWQVGPSIKDGMPAKHDFKPENLNSFGKLELVKTQNRTGTAPAASPSPLPGGGGPSRQTGNDRARSGSTSLWSCGLVFYGLLLFTFVAF